jgi:HSP20 family protein
MTPGRGGEGTRRGSEFDEFFDRFFGDWGGLRESRGWSPAVDMVDGKDEVVVRADLPGLDQKDLHVSVENGRLTIRGERKEEQEEREQNYYCCERWAGKFSRTLTLPPQVDADKIRANFKNGILEIHLPKTKEALGRRIDIQAA